MIYIIITCCLLNENNEIRKMQYTQAITTVINYCNNKDNIKIVLVENNGNSPSFLDNFNIPVLYTNTNNTMYTKNKGSKELNDVNLCIHHFGIKDDDFIVKMTGRYIITNPCPFFEKLNDIDKLDCIIRYGYYLEPAILYKKPDCITGLIGMRCRNVKNIITPKENECVEWAWANESMLIPDEKVCILPELGIYIAPGSNNYFRV
jgi:hypothetical protein